MTARPEIPLDPTEERIVSFVLGACDAMPERPTARIAGGWVRDKLLGRPSKDIDFAVDSMTGSEFANRLRQHAIGLWGPRQSVVGRITSTEGRPEQIKNLAVAFLRVHGQAVEILRLRKEEYREGDRNPVSVRPATAEEDALRRDLTINALFYNIRTRRVEDLTGRGLADLETMTLRTPLDPTETFTSDPLRLLRVLRFHSRYPDSRIAPETLYAMYDPGVQHQIVRRVTDPDETAGIVVERTADELRGIMLGDQPGEAVRIMHKTDLLRRLLDLPADWLPLSMDQNNPHHSLSVIDHTVEAVGHANDLAREFGLSDADRAALNLAALTHDLGKLDPRSHKANADGTTGYSGNPDDAEGRSHEEASAETWGRLARALKLSDEDRKLVHGIVAGHMRPHALVECGEPRARALRRYRRKNPNWELQFIHAMADAMAKGGGGGGLAEPYRLTLARLRDAGVTDAGVAKDLLSGQEIMRIVGLPAKPPAGLTGYIEVAKERIREHRDDRPDLTEQEAADIVRGMADAGEFEAYRMAT